MAMARSLGAGIVEPPSSGAVSGVGVPSAAAGEPDAQPVNNSRPDKSIAGAEVILGGFAAAVLPSYLATFESLGSNAKRRHRLYQ
ncbi:unnamed protein product [Musa textilis]